MFYSQALEFLKKNFKEFCLRKISRLNVSGAFHTNLMEPSIKPFKKALETIKVSDPAISVHSNVDGKRYLNADHIRKQLPKQVRVFICSASYFLKACQLF